jgi:hypothetical protein
MYITCIAPAGGLAGGRGLRICTFNIIAIMRLTVLAKSMT